MTYSLESIGVMLSYEFDDNIHDRSIELNNGWKIVLGRDWIYGRKLVAGMI